MKEFKSNPLVILKNVLFAVCAGFVLAIIANFFLSPTISKGLGALAFLGGTYFAVVLDNIRVDKLTFYRGKKETHSFTISECSFHSLIRSTTGDSSCDLTIKTHENDYGTTIDCSMLGRGRYLQLLDALGFNDQEPVNISTTKRNK
ncbi:hypothetical protein [Fusobacterium ulcerans]|uniref:hypothetical protein n=1 Tax=Fusobacterium ulcerans TaxID=861 RepID=UPI002671A0CB|nr:hypothetical protein [Fusobacterium ulcerans]